VTHCVDSTDIRAISNGIQKEVGRKLLIKKRGASL
jgi:hypothetical protein